MRDAAMAVVQASLSLEGYAKALDCMFMNSFLGQVMGAPQILNEYSYNFSIFGTPSNGAPWGWQLTGHHLVLNCLLVGGQMVISPFFFGAEPNEVDEGPRAGLRLLTAEEEIGLTVINALSGPQRDRAILYDDPYSPEVPEGRVHPADHLHLGGMARDNTVIPNEGAPVCDFTPTQQALVMKIVERVHSAPP